MKVKKTGAAVSLLAAGTLMLSACGSDDNTASSGSGDTGSAPTGDCGGKESLKASGSSAQANAMTRFINAYEKDCPGFTLNYTSSGSGAGVSEFIGGQTDFGGSDSPLSAEKGEYDRAKERCGGSDAWNLPAVFGPIAVTYNVEGVDGLVLDGPTLGKIFNGTVKTWDAPEIAALNEGATLPAAPINVIFRSDESGTTDNFQKYLDAASDGAWGKGAGKSFAGGVGEGAKGNEGTSAAIASTPGSITYNEWSFAKAQNLSIAKIITSAGPEPVELNTESAGVAIDGVKFKGEGNDLVLDTASFYMPTEPGSYPIMLAAYEIVCSQYPDPEVATAVKAFMHSALGNGQTGLEENGYIPVPEAFKTRLTEAVDAINSTS
ncbi:phosphate ABC transporter substrate-binding protein PstS [Mycolicibacterium pyrenivorans]|uniref:phosphate ABC transporter substrate-binding protein PstS n=1 Tax=Mycolicibacterium pyrenivorans TaxID=187102 RepID=UPI0021F2FBB2|nr:phosphate ABC transporter substrate-binding protein PstS [Mycolicibacterium pyrenivorans]MCV7150638.1 phosphate ABC transporter substrate-binding protein PstS [Mycolicibacterium pyrenivorans]